MSTPPTTDPTPTTGRADGPLPRLFRRLLNATTAGAGRIVLAERFRAPAGLLALRLPTDTLRGRELGASETFRVFLIGGGGWRRLTLQAASVERHAVLDIAFAGFSNPEGAMFHLLVTRRRLPGEMRLGLLQRWLLRADLGWQAPIVLGGNAELPGFATLRLRPAPAEQMQLVEPQAG